MPPDMLLSLPQAARSADSAQLDPTAGQAALLALVQWQGDAAMAVLCLALDAAQDAAAQVPDKIACIQLAGMGGGQPLSIPPGVAGEGCRPASSWVTPRRLLTGPSGAARHPADP